MKDGHDLDIINANISYIWWVMTGRKKLILDMWLSPNDLNCRFSVPNIKKAHFIRQATHFLYIYFLLLSFSNHVFIKIIREPLNSTSDTSQRWHGQRLFIHKWERAISKDKIKHFCWIKNQKKNKTWLFCLRGVRNSIFHKIK